MADINSPSLSIIIVNWNSGLQLRDCISSIRRARTDCVTLAKIVVVDNDSSDGSLDLIDPVGMAVSLIRCEKNNGFAAACNLGAAEASGDYLLFLNPDTVLFENSLATPISFMQRSASAEIGICGIHLLDEQGRPSTCASHFPTVRVMTGKIFRLTKFFPRLFPAGLLMSSDLSEGGYVDQVMGAFFLIRQSVFDLCGGFDERFFVYYEEVDLSIRARDLGYSSYIVSEASAFHKGGGCSEQVKPLRLFYSLRSRILYAEKHYSRLDLFLVVLLTAFELLVRLLHSLSKASLADVKNTLSAYIRLVRYFLRSPERSLASDQLNATKP